MCLYEESVRTPILFKWPAGTNAVGLRTEPVSHVDVLPTICAGLGVTPPERLPGRSLAQPNTGPANVERDIFIQYDGNGGLGNFSRCVIRGTNKFIVDIFKDERFFELYDLADDPEELRNLVREHPDRAAGLFAALIRHMRDTGDHLVLAEQHLDSFLAERIESWFQTTL